MPPSSYRMREFSIPFMPALPLPQCTMPPRVGRSARERERKWMWTTSTTVKGENSAFFSLLVITFARLSVYVYVFYTFASHCRLPIVKEAVFFLLHFSYRFSHFLSRSLLSFLLKCEKRRHQQRGKFTSLSSSFLKHSFLQGGNGKCENAKREKFQGQICTHRGLIVASDELLRGALLPDHYQPRPLVYWDE